MINVLLKANKIIMSTTKLENMIQKIHEAEKWMQKVINWPHRNKNIDQMVGTSATWLSYDT